MTRKSSSASRSSRSAAVSNCSGVLAAVTVASLGPPVPVVEPVPPGRPVDASVELPGARSSRSTSMPGNSCSRAPPIVGAYTEVPSSVDTTTYWYVDSVGVVLEVRCTVR